MARFLPQTIGELHKLKKDRWMGSDEERGVMVKTKAFSSKRLKSWVLALHFLALLQWQ